MASPSGLYHLARTRSRSYPQTVIGKCYRKDQAGNILVTISNVPGVGLEQVCQDDTGYGVDHILNITEKVDHVQALMGETLNLTGPKYSYANYRPERFANAGSASGFIATPPYDLNTLKVQLQAGTNPSRADVDLAVSIGELRAAPRAVFTGIRDAVREIRSSPALLRALRNGYRNGFERRPLSTTAGGYLAMEFGIKPLISDVKNLLKAQELTNNRLRELENLRDGNGMRRKKTLRTFSSKTTPSDITIASANGLVIPAKRTTYVQQKIWGTMRWEADPNFRPPTTEHGRILEARRAALGLNIDLVSAWNLMPWSWMIDYFVKVGDLLETTRNSVGATSGHANIMVQTIRTGGITSNPPPGVTGGSGLSVTTTKQRFIVAAGAGLGASLPILTGKQVSILGALAITRFPRGR